MAAWIAAGSAIVGDLMSQQGQQQTNAASAAEAQQNRQFQADQQMQVEGWETEMSNTAMQRRVQDLQIAGLNPLLAVSQGGASQPSVSPASGSMPAFGNPGSAFGNLGTQVTGAIQASQQADLIKSQTDNLQAQAAKTRSETPTPGVTKVNDDGSIDVSDDYHQLGDAQLAQIQATTGVTRAQAQQVGANIDLINAQLKNTNADTALKNVQQALQDQNVEILKATKASLIQQQLAAGKSAANQESVQSGTYGRVLAYINSALHPISSAAGAASHFIP